MKRIQTLCLVILLVANGIAQDYPRKFISIDYTPFIGKWIYQSNDTIFRIDLQPITSETKYFVVDRLLGGYSLTVNDTVITNCFNDYPSNTTLLYDLVRQYDVGIEAYMYVTQEDQIPNLTRNQVKTTFYDKIGLFNNGEGIDRGRITSISNDSIHWFLNENVFFDDSKFSDPTAVIMIREE